MTKGGVRLPKLSERNSYRLVLDKAIVKGRPVLKGQRIGKLLVLSQEDAEETDAPRVSGAAEDCPNYGDNGNVQVSEIVLYNETGKGGWITAVHYKPETQLDPRNDADAWILDLTDESICPHDVVINSLCCGCGEVVLVEAHRKLASGIQISKNYAETLSQPKITELYRSRKLMLILDLDHTLIHADQYSPPADFLSDTRVHSFAEEVSALSASEPYVPGCIDAKRQVLIDGRALKAEFEIQLENGSVDYCQYIEDAETDARSARQVRVLESAVFLMTTKCEGWSEPLTSHFKLRPGVFKFLRSMSQLYELYIYTAGIKQHAATALALLDPDRRFFPSSHVLSREDVSQDGVKSLSRVLPSDHHAMIVIDDTPAAWDNDVGLLVCYPYVWFGTPLDHFLLPKHPFALDIKVNAFRRAIWQYAPSKILTALSKLPVESQAAPFLEHDVAGEAGHPLWVSKQLEERFGEPEPRELKDSDLQLFCLCGILRACHTLYYDALDESRSRSVTAAVRIPSLKLILDKIKGSVLKGSRVYFGDPPPGWQTTQSCATFKSLGCEVIHNDEIRRPTHVLLNRTDSPPPNLAATPVTMEWLEFSACTLTKPENELFHPSTAREMRVFWDACLLADASGGSESKRQRRLPGAGIQIAPDISGREWLEARNIDGWLITQAVLAESDIQKPMELIAQAATPDEDLETALLRELGQD